MHPARRTGGADSPGWSGLERAERSPRGAEVRRLVEPLGRAAKGLDPGGLSHAAHPRRRAAAEVEVLPRYEAARILTARAVISSRMRRRAAANRTPASPRSQKPCSACGLLEGRERLQLETAAGVVLKDLAATEAHLVAGRGVGEPAPVLAVALASCRNEAGMRVGVRRRASASAHRVDHVAELGVAGAPLSLRRATSESTYQRRQRQDDDVVIFARRALAAGVDRPASAPAGRAGDAPRAARASGLVELRATSARAAPARGPLGPRSPTGIPSATSACVGTARSWIRLAWSPSTTITSAASAGAPIDQRPRPRQRCSLQVPHSVSQHFVGG